MPQGHVDPRFGPGEGAILFSAEAATSTESLALPDVPLEVLWGIDSGPVTPILSTGNPVRHDLPLSDHPSVEDWVELLARTGGRGAFRTWLARSTRYVPLFYEILDRYQLPRDLVFLAMVESGFSPRAFSWATASGPWQFMPVTGKRYGLRIGFWVDERRDFVKATHAAARHLRWLYSVFEDWHLAMAAYNAGAGGIRSAMRRTGAKSFWSLRQTRRIRRETKGYVPKILASAIVSKRPEHYGFVDIPYQPPMVWDTVEVDVATSLKDIGEACGGLPGQALADLNPELRVGVTPPGEVWTVRVPEGFGPSCTDGLAAFPKSSRWTFRYYEAEEGEMLNEIARRFGTSEEAILRFHALKDTTKLDFFAELAVPVPFDSSLPITAPPERRRGGAYGPGKARMITYRVKPGDSLWKVARRFDVRLAKLRAWNGKFRSNALRVGQRLRVMVGRASKRVDAGRSTSKTAKKKSAQAAVTKGRHRVREGESLWIIARRYDTTVEHLRSLNGLRAGAILSIGQVLRVR